MLVVPRHDPGRGEVFLRSVCFVPGFSRPSRDRASSKARRTVQSGRAAGPARHYGLVAARLGRPESVVLHAVQGGRRSSLRSSQPPRAT